VRLALPGLVLCLALAKQNGAATPRIQILPNESARRVDVVIDGKPFTSYIWPENLAKPVLYPLHAADGTVVTRGFPLEPRTNSMHFKTSADGLNWGDPKDPGTLPTDRTKGNHPDVVVSADGRAYLFYFTHQVGADAEGKPAGWKRHTVIQVAELELQDGILTCDRNKPVDIDLVPQPNAVINPSPLSKPATQQYKQHSYAMETDCRLVALSLDPARPLAGGTSPQPPIRLSEIHRDARSRAGHAFLATRSRLRRMDESEGTSDPMMLWKFGSMVPTRLRPLRLEAFTRHFPITQNIPRACRAHSARPHLWFRKVVPFRHGTYAA